MSDLLVFFGRLPRVYSEFIAITQQYEKAPTLSWAVSPSIIPLHYSQQPSKNKSIKLLRSVDNIKAETLFLHLLDIVKLFSLCSL